MARTRETERDTPAVNAEATPNPVWFKPIMFGFMILGLVWIIVYNVSSGAWPVQAIGTWNIAVGFGLMFIGFIMATRWR